MSTTVMVRDRRGGKTYAVATWIVQQAIDNPESRIIVGLKDIRHMKYIVEYINEILGEYGPVRFYSSRDRIEFYNGATASAVEDSRMDLRNVRGGIFTGATGEQLQLWSQDLLDTVRVHNRGPAFFTADKWGPMVEQALGDSYTASTATPWVERNT